ncbi:uncharacterized protein EAF02_006144 [Botrytis sinoallii]|uniref:uncharacterized protein n=1 Tax=Botrytis sinoallii TaxID=1463999 RepID=UPI0019017108|nr:uncharacterized protein EAF02_006144 [Botrytis sinoallii]KAF7882781.1 hypothetical protein EAF02_006144 [Botrytis sinoallii]
MPPINRVTEFVNRNNPTAKEFIPFLKKQDATFWHLVFSESTILEAMTSQEVLKDMPPLEGQQLQVLFAGLCLSGEEQGPKWILSDKYNETPLERADDQEHVSPDFRGAKMERSNKRLRGAMGEVEVLDSGSEKEDDEIIDSFQKCTNCRKPNFAHGLFYKQRDNFLCTHCQVVSSFHRRRSGTTSVSSLPLGSQANDAEPIQNRCESGSPLLLAKSSTLKAILPSVADLPHFLGLQTPETQSCQRAIKSDPMPIPLSFDDSKSPDRRSQVPDMPVASVDQDAYQYTSRGEPSPMKLDDNISSPPSLVAQSREEIALKPSSLKSQPLVSEKKNSLKAFLFKAMKAKSESVTGDVDAVLPSFQDSDFPLEHILKLIIISQISTCAKKDKICAEIAQVRCDFELHNLVEEAGMAVDPTVNLKKGHPVDIRKAMYYEKLAKINFSRAEGNLATCTEKDLKLFLDDCRKQKRVGGKISQLVDSFGKGVLFLYPFFMPELQKGGDKQDRIQEVGTLRQGLASHWTTQLAQITTLAGPEATIMITIKVWDSLENDHIPTLEFQRWLTEVFMLKERPQDGECTVKRMSSMRQLNYDDSGIIALHNSIAIYDGQADYRNVFGGMESSRKVQILLHGRATCEEVV